MDGFTFTVRKKREHNPVVESMVEEKKSAVDKSLDEIAAEQRSKKLPKTNEVKWNPKGDSRSKEKHDKRKVIPIRLPRHVIVELAEREGLVTEGYSIRLEAVIQ